MRQNKVGEQNLFKQLGRSSFTLVCSALVCIVSASSFADFRKTQSTTFQNYKDESDRTFGTYLKSEWEAYFVAESIPIYEKAKPRELSPARIITVKDQGPHVSIKIQKQVDQAQEFDTQENIVDKKDIDFDFYGTNISINIPQGMQTARYYPQSKEGISNYFQSVALSPYEFLLTYIQNVSSDLNLNDWGKYLLIKKISESIFTTQDESRLLAWFLFNKLGYSVRVGLSNSHVVVMYYSEKVIYATPNYKLGTKKFYVLSDYAKGSAEKVFTYNQNYPEAEKALDLSMETLPRFVNERMQKTLNFKQYGKKYTIQYDYNKNLIDFMATYPQADYETFFNTPLDSLSYQSIAKELKKYINSKQASVALNFVLNFVQNAFIYEVDSQQFGREKIMFAEETLFYDKSDCEDRAVLFSNLIKELFQISVVGVKYKDHMATALYIPMNGDAVKVNSKKFIIADPTYMNASIGQSIPKYRQIKPDRFIVLK
mgnify:CR=1 FL=1